MIQMMEILGVILFFLPVACNFPILLEFPWDRYDLTVAYYSLNIPSRNILIKPLVIRKDTRGSLTTCQEGQSGEGDLRRES